MRGGTSSTFTSRSGGTVSGGTATFGGESRMGRFDRDHDHDRDRHRRFRDRDFAFGVYPGYDYYASDYDDGCYRWEQVPTRSGWRWLRVWVCD